MDATVDDGDIRHAATRERGVLRIIGTPEQSWDWPHIEYVGQLPGFGSIEELIVAVRWCDSTGAKNCAEPWRSGEGRREKGRIEEKEEGPLLPSLFSLPRRSLLSPFSLLSLFPA